jgi:hypothetical protein
MTFPIQSATPPLYRFRLVTDNQNLICDPEPLEWASGSLEINRDLNIGGVFACFQLESLTFTGNGAKLLSDLFTLFEVNAKCDLIVEWFNYQQREYVEFPSRFNINFGFFERVKIGLQATGVRVKAVNSDTQTKLESRKDIDVDLTKLVSIGGVTIADYPDMKKLMDYDPVNIFNFASLLVDTSINTNGYKLPRQSTGPSFVSVPLTVEKSDFKEIRTVKYSTGHAQDTFISQFITPALFDYEMEVNYIFNFSVRQDHTGTPPWSMYFLQTTLTGERTEYLIGSFGNETGLVTFSSGLNMSLKKGDSVRLVVRVANIENTEAYIGQSVVSFTQKVVSSPEKTTEGFPLYEATERVLQHILDNRFPLYSEHFGRTDTTYNANGAKYQSENQLRFAHIQTGLNLRGVKLSGVEAFSLNFKDLFKGLQAIYNVGYGLEKMAGETHERVRIEPYAHFFQNTLALDLSSRIHPLDIVSQVMPELIPVHIKSGFDNFEYLEINGRAEPNTTSERTSVMNTDSKFDCICPLRGDTKGIYSALSTEYDTKDSKGDNKVFIVKSQRAGAKVKLWGGSITYELPTKTQWKAEKAQNIEVVGDTSVFKNDLLNRYFTPTRMLKRSANRLKAGMTKFNHTALRFQSSDKLQGLKTTGEGYTIAENEDMPLSSMDNPIFKAMKHTVVCDFDLTDLTTLLANKTGYIKFTDNLSGYLLSLKKKNNQAQAEITIVERYVS